MKSESYWLHLEAIALSPALLLKWGNSVAITLVSGNKICWTSSLGICLNSLKEEKI
jgi:hypothetical protein